MFPEVGVQVLDFRVDVGLGVRVVVPAMMAMLSADNSNG